MEDESLINHVYESLKFPREYPSLGRREDIGVIEGVEIVELKEEIYRNIKEDGYSKYISSLEMERMEPRGLDSYKIGSRYILNKDYILKNIGSKNNPRYFRQWNTVDVVYTKEISSRAKALYIDNYKNPVFFI